MYANFAAKNERENIQNMFILDVDVDQWNVINLLIVSTIFALSTLGNDVRVKREFT